MRQVRYDGRGQVQVSELPKGLYYVAIGTGAELSRVALRKAIASFPYSALSKSTPCLLGRALWLWGARSQGSLFGVTVGKPLNHEDSDDVFGKLHNYYEIM